MPSAVRTLFIGAGPANLVAANCLLDANDRDFAMCEVGKPLEQRYCPTNTLNTCVLCPTGCDVTAGVGGTAALYGNKLCYFPASDAILRFFDRDTINAACEYLDALLPSFFDSSLITWHTTVSMTSAGRRKEYRSEQLTRLRFMTMIRVLADRLMRDGLLRSGVRVLCLSERPHGGFVAETDTGESIEARTVVIGSGRSSYRWLIEQFKRLGVTYNANSQDVGIRLEADLDAFRPEYVYQLDPKFKFSYGSLGSARTFCGEPRGVVVPVEFGGGMYAEGAYLDELTSLNNIGVMARTTLALGVEEIELWCKQINQLFGNSLVAGLIDLAESCWFDRLLDLIRDGISWPSQDHREIMARCAVDVYRKMFCASSSASIVLYAPSIDRYWPRPHLRRGLEANVKGIHIIGDAAGVSRGFVQAMASGAAWAVAQRGRPSCLPEPLWSALA